jgi:hypothetical protein
MYQTRSKFVELITSPVCIVFLALLFITDIGTRWYTYSPKYITVKVPVKPEEVKPEGIKDGYSTPPTELVDSTVLTTKAGDIRWMNPNDSAMDLSQKVWLKPNAKTTSQLTYPAYTMKITRLVDSFEIVAPNTYKWTPQSLMDGQHNDWWAVTKVQVWSPNKNLMEKSPPISANDVKSEDKEGTSTP